MNRRLAHRDLLFLIDTLMPNHADPESAARLIQSDYDRIEQMLDDERLFRRLTADQEILVKVSPWLFFTVLLRRAHRDLRRERFTVERRHRQWVLLFDTEQVAELLSDENVLDYLASMLASFARIESLTV